MNEQIASINQGLTDASNGFKQVMIALTIFAFVSTIAFIVIAVKK